MLELDDLDERARVGLADDLDHVFDLVGGDDDLEDVLLLAGEGALSFDEGRAMGDVGHDDAP